MKSRNFYFFYLIIALIFNSCEKNETIEPPFITSAGSNKFNISEFNVKLNANSLLSNEVGKWTILSGLIESKVFFENKKDPKTVFNGMPGETYKLMWLLENKQGKIASDTVNINFSPLKTKISVNDFGSHNKTNKWIIGENYDRGEWTIEGDKYLDIESQCNNKQDFKNCHDILLYGYENKNYTLKWKTWYGSKSASDSTLIKTGVYTQNEALQDLGILYSQTRYNLDNNNNVIRLNMGGDPIAWIFDDLKNYPTMRAFVYLKKLYLSGSPLWNFPEVIGDKYLDLEFLDFGGNRITKLPDNIGNLTKLETLLIDNNQLGKKMPFLPESFGYLKNLKTLNLSSMGINKLPNSFSKLKNLTSLNLDGNAIDKLPEDFDNLVELVTFVSPGLSNDLPRSFSNLINLKTCVINMLDDFPNKLPEDFGRLTKLESLSLFGQFEMLPKSFSNLSKLEYLKISGELKEFPEDIGELRNLKRIIAHGYFKRLPNSLSELNNLEILDLTGSKLESLPIGFGNLTKLESLQLLNHKLKELPDNFGNLKNLRLLNLSSNNIERLPESFGNLEKVYNIDLSYNQISTFPSSISNLSDTLTNLTIRGNNYTDEEFERLKKLLPKTNIVRY